jgi:nucleoside-diphosphate-sugar epimerase
VRSQVAKSVADQNTVFLPWGRGDAVIPLVGAEDVARVATVLLTGTAAGRQNAYDLIGETPSVNEIVNTLGRVLKRPIRYVEVTDEQWAQAVAGRMNSHALDHLSNLWQFFRNLRNPQKGEWLPDQRYDPNPNWNGPADAGTVLRENAEVFGGVREGSASGHS